MTPCLFPAWIDAKSLGRGAEMAFTRDNFLSFRTLEGIADLRTQFAQLLHEAGFLGARAGKGCSRGPGGGKGGGSSSGRGGVKRASPRRAAVHLPTPVRHPQINPNHHPTDNPLTREC